ALAFQTYRNPCRSIGFMYLEISIYKDALVPLGVEVGIFDQVIPLKEDKENVKAVSFDVYFAREKCLASGFDKLDPKGILYHRRCRNKFVIRPIHQRVTLVDEKRVVEAGDQGRIIKTRAHFTDFAVESAEFAFNTACDALRQVWRRIGLE